MVILFRLTKSFNFHYEGFGNSYDEVARRWNLSACGAAVDTSGLTTTAAQQAAQYKQEDEKSREAFATDYATIAKNWSLTPCGVVDEDDLSGMTEEELVNYRKDIAAETAMMGRRKEGFATDYPTIAKNWSLTPCGVVDEDDLSGMTEEELVNYRKDIAAETAMMSRRKEGFATDYPTIAKNWSLTPCGVVDEDDLSGMTEEELVNYRKDIAAETAMMSRRKEGFATDYPTIAKNWNLSPCGVNDEDTKGLTEEQLVNYMKDLAQYNEENAIANRKDNFAVSFDKLISR
jgi:predicted metal-binding transcription factor (methanogenesis marker protein 9)